MSAPLLLDQLLLLYLHLILFYQHLLLLCLNLLLLYLHPLLLYLHLLLLHLHGMGVHLGSVCISFGMSFDHSCCNVKESQGYQSVASALQPTAVTQSQPISTQTLGSCFGVHDTGHLGFQR